MQLKLKVSIFALFATALSSNFPKQASKMFAFNKYHGLRLSNITSDHIMGFDNEQV